MDSWSSRVTAAWVGSGRRSTTRCPAKGSKRSLRSCGSSTNGTRVPPARERPKGSQHGGCRLVALRVGERPPLDAVQDPILPVPRAAERLDPGRGVYQVGGTEVQVDPDLSLLRLGDALDTERREVGATFETRKRPSSSSSSRSVSRTAAQKSAIRSASCASIVM